MRECHSELNGMRCSICISSSENGAFIIGPVLFQFWIVSMRKPDAVPADFRYIVDRAKPRIDAVAR